MALCLSSSPRRPLSPLLPDFHFNVLLLLCFPKCQKMLKDRPFSLPRSFSPNKWEQKQISDTKHLFFCINLNGSGCEFSENEKEKGLKKVLFIAVNMSARASLWPVETLFWSHLLYFPTRGKRKIKFYNFLQDITDSNKKYMHTAMKPWSWKGLPSKTSVPR